MSVAAPPPPDLFPTPVRGPEPFARLADQWDPEPDPYVSDPAGWAQEKLDEHLWSAQIEICESVRDNRFTAVQSAHGTGKSFIASRIVAWWLSVHPVGDAFVVTSAPSAPQVKAILWREVKRAHRKGKLAGYITDAEIPEWKIDGELVGFGRKPADYIDAEKAATSFQGIHARFVLVILDEACGVPEWLWTATESLVTNEASRVLAIGNPDDPATEFAKVCAPGSGWHNIAISAFDTPAFTGEPVPEILHEVLTSELWVNERKKRWGETSPLYKSKVLGLFPEVSDDTLITPTMVRQAIQETDRTPEALLTPGRLGCDIARYGDDETVIYRNRNGHVRRLKAVHKQDTMKTTGVIAKVVKVLKLQCPAVVDVIGIGAGVFDRLYEQGLPAVAFNASERAFEPEKYKNRRAEAYWMLRELFEEGLVDLDPEDEDLAAQLQAIRFTIDSSGRIVIESKDKMKSRGLPSPDRADAVMMSAVAAPATQAVVDEETESITGDLMSRPL